MFGITHALTVSQVAQYLENLQSKLGATELRVLRSDGGLFSKDVAKDNCANLLYSVRKTSPKDDFQLTVGFLKGPAGGVAGVVANVVRQTEYKNLLTFDMGGTSTDVCLIENGVPELRRETTVGDLTVRVPSVDVRTVGAGGGMLIFIRLKPSPNIR